MFKENISIVEEKVKKIWKQIVIRNNRTCRI